MSYVYIVFYCVTDEGETVVGVYDNYVNARDFELQFLCKHPNAVMSNWTEIRKVELNKVYDNVFDKIGDVI